jgi:hypothetical protein
MDSDSFMILFDFIILIYGVYMVYSGFQMKKTHRPPNIIINETELVGAKDVPGFCDAMFKPLVVFGILAVLYGVVGFINDKYMDLAMLNFVTIAVFLVACVWFLRLTKKYRTTYIK